MNKKWSTRMMVEGGVMIALATALSMIPLYKAPFGGTITPGSMIPIIVFAMRWGLVKGLIVGFGYGLIQAAMATTPFLHWAQFFLDYPLAFGALGLSGLAHNAFKRSLRNNGKSSLVRDYGVAVFAILISILGRGISHILSGVIFFSEYAGDMNPWKYSAIYNAQYLVPEFIISIVLIIILWTPLKKIDME
ncbi:energy-coupled thiamine transporter ThiT [Dethiothermospora halolimnae]|uniref:energy-coupled thiamine transporter ThiT n=1 Tax=Dethiothermospora halolimnae TaxID=3114390 RepID=UPI003CCC4000